ncbi:MAG TPA: NAD(P)H-binding protein [Nocardioidaceae bacterium]|nr:NAD(P)H-binding protein [Nocardioidaceae bacterium]
MRIAVAGGTGVVGRHVVRVASERGHDTVVLTRSQGVDLTTGAGLEGRLEGIDAVVDVTSVVTQNPRKARAFFGSVTKHLLAAEKAAGVAHHIALSIVGIDRATIGYYQGKIEQERLVVEGDVPWSVLRVTQFHDFPLQVLIGAAIAGFVPVPRVLTQPVASVEVAAALIDLVEAGPSGRVPDLAGPEPLQLVDMVRRVNKARGLGRRVVPIHVPGRIGKRLRAGALIPDQDGPRGQTTFEEWLVSPR